MVRNAIENDFRSSKMGGGHHNGQPVNHSGIYTVFALGQIHQFWFIYIVVTFEQMSFYVHKMGKAGCGRRCDIPRLAKHCPYIYIKLIKFKQSHKNSNLKLYRCDKSPPMCAAQYGPQYSSLIIFVENVCLLHSRKRDGITSCFGFIGSSRKQILFISL